MFSLPEIPVAIFDTSRQPRTPFEILAYQLAHVDLQSVRSADAGASKFAKTSTLSSTNVSRARVGLDNSVSSC